MLYWALKLKPGDIFGACTGFNHIVASTEVVRCSYERGWYIAEVAITDTRGQWHHCPGGGCAHPAYRREDILHFLREYTQDEWAEHQVKLGWDDPRRRYRPILEAEETSDPLLGPNGVLFKELTA